MAKSGSTAEVLDRYLMSVDCIVDIEEENVETHPYLTARGRRSCGLAYCYKGGRIQRNSLHA